MRALAFISIAAIGAVFATPGWADPPDGKGHGRGGGGGPPQAQGQGQGQGGSQGGGSYAGGSGRGGGGGSDTRYVVPDRDRDAIYGYYRGEYAAGHCPPGLAKKNNGCQPPGQAKKAWAVGQPLPRDVYYESLPPMLLGRLSPAPSGYQYVRVANDILMLVVGTRMVTAAVADLGRL